MSHQELIVAHVLFISFCGLGLAVLQLVKVVRRRWWGN